ncbi:MAG: hypothetical protein JKY48_02025 [Flavobacteriales bacterium]|nr:hypothetical protein [Flavobacteriales bacterium]
MKKIITTLFIATFFVSAAVCQDTLKLLGGDLLEVKIGKITDEKISYAGTHKSKRYFRSVNTEEVFSYRLKDKSEVLVYKYNPEVGNIYEVGEMYDYMIGGRHAEKEYRPLVSNIFALGAGIWSGYAISDGSHVLIAAPLIFSSLILIPGTRVQKHDVNKNYRGNSAYRDGYKRVAKGKKFLNALKFSGLGMLGSFIIFEVTD